MHLTSVNPWHKVVLAVIVDNPPDNGAVLNISKILKAVMSSAAKAKFGALYINTCEAIPMQQVLKEMGHKQPPTLIQTDNSTALGVVTNNIQPCCTKAMNMRFHWLLCCDSQGGTTGAQDPTTEPTIGPNIIALLITLKSVPPY